MSEKEQDGRSHGDLVNFLKVSKDRKRFALHNHIPVQFLYSLYVLETPCREGPVYLVRWTLNSVTSPYDV